jgi:hypothetical protein
MVMLRVWSSFLGSLRGVSVMKCRCWNFGQS